MIYCLVLETSFYHLEQHLKQCSFPLLCKQFFIDDAVFSQLFFFPPELRDTCRSITFGAAFGVKLLTENMYVCVCEREKDTQADSLGRQNMLLKVAAQAP